MKHTEHRMYLVEVKQGYKVHKFFIYSHSPAAALKDGKQLALTYRPWYGIEWAIAQEIKFKNGRYEVV